MKTNQGIGHLIEDKNALADIIQQKISFIMTNYINRSKCIWGFSRKKQCKDGKGKKYLIRKLIWVIQEIKDLEKFNKRVKIL